MSEPYLGEIRMFAGTFAPRNWAFCDGQLFAIASNEALFSLVGTTYGGDGNATFGLPDLRGRVPVHQGQGPGLSPRRLGSRSGAETVILAVSELASHSHVLKATSDIAITEDATDRVFASVDQDDAFYAKTNLVPMMPDAVGMAGGSRSHSNMMPSLCLNFIIALEGFYPSKS